MKVLVFGADGMLGSSLVGVLKAEFEIVKSFKSDLDIIAADSVRRFIMKEKPDWTINAAGFTDVDGCEAKKEFAVAVNGVGPLNIALACRDCGSKLVHFSTDYVFDGTKEGPYTENDIPSPVNAYGLSKLEGDRNLERSVKDLYLVRTQWLFGPNGRNFVDLVLDLLKDKGEIRVVNDQVGSPTYTGDLAIAVKKILKVSPPFGTYNVASAGYCSWFEFAGHISNSVGNAKTKIIPVKSEEFPRPASRPRNTRLDTRKFIEATAHVMPPWQEGLKRYLCSKHLIK